MAHIQVTPAYGRDYANQRAALADWNADKDFVDTWSQRVTNMADCEAMGLKVTIRYAKLTKLVEAK